MTESKVLLSSMVKEDLDNAPDGSWSIGVERHAEAIVDAVLDVYRRETPAGAIEAELERLNGQQVTLVQYGTNMLGATGIYVHEGKLFSSDQGTMAILPKGNRTNGLRVGNVLEVIEGYDVAEAEARVARVRAQFPEVKRLTQERLEELPKHGRGKDCSLAVFGGHPFFGSHDCLWLIGEYWPDDDIVERCVLLIRPEHGESETGSIFGQQLLAMPVGEVVGFVPASWSHAARLTELDYETAVDAALHGSKAVTT